jgi:glyoxylase-like metal-dependent hydrolase (beta-lactamase superfamily II)
MSAKIYPVKLGVFYGTDYSHNVLNKNFGVKVDNSSASFIVIDNGEIIVVDTGFKIDPENPASANLKGNTADAFKEKFESLNIDFNDVTKIILTHLHWDHCANNELFPNARIFVQRAEMEYAAAPIDPLYYDFKLTGLLLHDCGHRITFVDGDMQITENVGVSLVVGHTLGSQCVIVKIRNETVIITGDLCNVYENLETRSPKEIDCLAWRKSIDKIKAIGTIFLPAHDLTVFDKYPVIE